MGPFQAALRVPRRYCPGCREALGWTDWEMGQICHLRDGGGGGGGGISTLRIDLRSGIFSQMSKSAQ